MQTKVGQPFVQSTLDTDKTSIENMGFFKAVDVRAEPLEEDWRVLVDVAEWAEVKEIRVTGNEAVKTEDILRVITIQPGELFNVTSVGPSIRAIEEMYREKGFFGQVIAFGPLDESENTLQVTIVEMKVNSIQIEGNQKTKESIIRRLIKTRPGDPFNLDKWQSDLGRLFGTGWFDDIDVPEQPSPELGLIDLKAVVKEARTGQFNIGVSIDPRSSFAGFIRVSDPNFRGTGQNIGLNLAQTSRGGGTSIDIDYTNPFYDRHDTSMSVSLYSKVLYRFAGSAFGGDDTPTEDSRYIERRTGAALGFSRPIGDKEYVSIAGRHETIDTKDLETTLSDAFIQQDGQLTTFTAGYTRNRRDLDIDPSRGDWLRATVEPGFANITRVGGAINDPTLVGRSTYVKTSIDYRAYFSPQPPRTLDDIAASRRVFAARLQVGMINGDVPFFEQFFVGGSNSLRGYEEDRFWGKNMLQATLEYRHPIQKSLNLIGFVDYGGAWGGYNTVGDFFQTDSMDLKLGYGLGLGVKVPGIGFIRLDLGFNENGKSRTHFVLGSSF